MTIISNRGGTGYQTIYVGNFCHAQHEILFSTCPCSMTVSLLYSCLHKSSWFYMPGMKKKPWYVQHEHKHGQEYFFHFGHNLLGISKAERELRMSKLLLVFKSKNSPCTESFIRLKFYFITWGGTWHIIKTNFIRVNDQCMVTILFNLNISFSWFLCIKIHIILCYPW